MIDDPQHNTPAPPDDADWRASIDSLAAAVDADPWTEVGEAVGVEAFEDGPPPLDFDDAGPASAPPAPSAPAVSSARQAARTRATERAEQQAAMDLRREQERAAGEQELCGTIVRIKFSGEDFFVIAELRLPGTGDDRAERGDDRTQAPLTVKGALAGIAEWCDVRLRGKWTTNARYGRQFEFSEGEVLLPSSTKGAERFLALHLPSVGPRRARLILEAFASGPDGLAGLWRVLDESPEQLTGIPGISDADIPEIAKEYRQARGLRDQEVWLRALNLGPKRTTKLLATFREATRSTLEADPYVVMDLKGFGFKLADDLAKRIGVSNDHPGRARAALLHVLQEAAEGEGHTYLPQQELLTRTDELSVPAERVLALITQLASPEGGRRIVALGEPGPTRQVALATLADAEQRIAEQIIGRLQLPRGERAVAHAGATSPRPAAAAVSGPAALPADVAPAAPAPAAPSAAPAPRGPELDRERKLPPLGRRAWQRSGRAAALDSLDLFAPAGTPPAPAPAPSAAAAAGLGALDANALAAALGVRPRRNR